MQFWLANQVEAENEEDLLNTLSPQLLSCDILPLVMNDGEVSLDPHPSESSLPVSPIFLNDLTKKAELLPADLETAIDAQTVQEIGVYFGFKKYLRIEDKLFFFQMPFWLRLRLTINHHQTMTQKYPLLYRQILKTMRL